MKFEHTEVWGFKSALRGMRNPKNSWYKNDTFEFTKDTTDTQPTDGRECGENRMVYIGPNDLKLAQGLIKAGPEHRKFMRQITVSVDITAPLYWY